jgi:hypothetical protein
MKKLTERKKAELRLIADLTLDATLAVEERLSRLAGRTRAVHSSTRKHVRK